METNKSLKRFVFIPCTVLHRLLPDDPGVPGVPDRLHLTRADERPQAARLGRRIPSDHHALVLHCLAASPGGLQRSLARTLDQARTP